MILRKTSYRLIITGLLIGVGLIWGIIAHFPDKRMHLVVCDVGQGDAMLIFSGSNQVIVDGGPNNKIVDCLSRYLPFWDRTIEVVVLTHAQADHVTGLISVLERFDVEQIIVNGLINDIDEFWAFREQLIDEEVEVYLPKVGDKIVVGEISLEVKWPRERQGSDIVWKGSGTADVLGIETYSGEINETSIVLELEFGDFNALLTGDIGLDTEQALITEGVLSNMEMLKVGHHGSKYASSSEFLRVIDPEIAVISVGRRNSYGHPTSDTLMRLDGVDAKVFRTDEHGDIEIISDGKRYWVEY